MLFFKRIYGQQSDLRETALPEDINRCSNEVLYHILTLQNYVKFCSHVYVYTV